MRAHYMKGTVKWFNQAKGYGFITPDSLEENPKDIFVHLVNIKTLDGTLTEGQRVVFEVTKGRKGDEAIEVMEEKSE